MERKMIFVKDWSTLLQGLITMVRRFEKPFTNHVSRLWFGTNLFLSEYWVRKFSFLQIAFIQKKKQSSCFTFRLKGNTFLKFSNFVSWLRLSLTNINLPMLFTIRQQFSWQLRWMQLTFIPLSRDTRLFTQGHTCVNRMQGHTCVNRKPDSNSKR
jgi:hypothetical protein